MGAAAPVNKSRGARLAAPSGGRDNDRMIDSSLGRLRDLLWRRRPSDRLQAVLVAIGRHVWVMVRDLADGQLSLRAMSLVYTTLLSIVPMLALAFSLLKALGAQATLEPMLLNLLEPLGEQAHGIVQNVIGFVENIKVGVLGSLGVGLLLYTAVSMIQKVEASFNYIWRIERLRSLGQRFGEYLSVLTVGPLLVFVAMGVTASVLSSDQLQALARIEPFGFLLHLFARLAPYLLMIGLFTFLYAFVPNTRVRLRAAAGGGIFAGVLWQSASLAFASFVAQATNYNAVYSGFAIVIFLLIWLYLGWLILLLGCQLSFYLQHPEHLTPYRVAPRLSCRSAETLGLAIAAEVVRRFVRGEPPVGSDALALAMEAQPGHVDRLVDLLQRHGVLAPAGTDEQALLPARDPATLTLDELWRLLRTGPEAEVLPASPAEALRAAAELVGRIEDTAGAELAGTSLRDWALGNSATVAASS